MKTTLKILSVLGIFVVSVVGFVFLLNVETGPDATAFLRDVGIIVVPTITLALAA